MSVKFSNISINSTFKTPCSIAIILEKSLRPIATLVSLHFCTETWSNVLNLVNYLSTQSQNRFIKEFQKYDKKKKKQNTYSLGQF